MSRSSSEATICSAKPASRRRSRFSVASSALRLGEGGLLFGELVAAGGERGGSAGQLIEFEQPGLVGVEQPGALALVARRAPFEPS